MTKAKPLFSNGIEYVQLSRLPYGQSLQFLEWLSLSSYIAIVENEQVLDDCVHYDDYDYWYDQVLAYQCEDYSSMESLI
jgi:hypothetical protein